MNDRFQQVRCPVILFLCFTLLFQPALLQQAFASTANYTYNPDSIRVRAEVQAGSTTDYLIDPYNHTGYAQVFKADVAGDPNTVYILGHDVLGQAKGLLCRYFLYDGHGSVRQFTTKASGTVIANYAYDAYGNAHGFDPANASTRLLYAGEMYDQYTQQYYLRARWYSPATGRLNRIDPFAGNNFDPQSLHKYNYVHNNPVNAVDPSGRLFSSPYHGRIVHDKIGIHFQNTSINDRLYNRRINTILKTKVKLWGWDKPDLVDRTTAEVWEIKPLGAYIIGRGQLLWYLYVLNTNDPFGRKWIPGVSYIPPSVVNIDAMSIAIVFPPKNGVIEYEVLDVRPAIAIVTAYNLARLTAEVKMATLRAVVLRVPF